MRASDVKPPYVLVANASIIDIGEFLVQSRGPQHHELLRLIGALVNQAPFYR